MLESRLFWQETPILESIVQKGEYTSAMITFFTVIMVEVMKYRDNIGTIMK